jgi:solute carrier family 35 protein C2
MVTAADSQPLSGWRRTLVISSLVFCWYTSSITIVFANKHMLSTRSFRYPFFMTAVNNGIVFVIAWLATRLPSFRQPALSRRVAVRIVFPIGLCTALDIGFSNWSLSMMSVSFFTILKGTIPAFVLIVAWLLKLERASALTGCSVILVVVGVGLASAAEVNFSGVGLVLGLISSLMGGTRWALTQLLMRRNHTSCGPALPRGGAEVGGAKGRGGASGDDGDGEEEVGEEQVQETISRHVNPLGSMLHISPVTAACALLPALVLEIFNAPWMPHGANHSAILDSQWVTSEELMMQLAGFLVVIALLVFILLLAEFAIVNLTSSLTLSILGILKELLTLALASGVRGEPLTALNMAGFALCSFGALLYHCIRQRKEMILVLRGAARYLGVCGGRGVSFVQMIEELDIDPASGVRTATRDADATDGSRGAASCATPHHAPHIRVLPSETPPAQSEQGALEHMELAETPQKGQ